MTTPVSPLPARLPPDLQTVFWLAALPLLAGAFLPWVLLRPNRLALGSYQGLPPAETALACTVAVGLVACARFFPRALTLLSAAALGLGVWWLGSRTGAALGGQGEAARASASSGAWLWFLGAGIATYGAGLVGERLGGAQRLLRWLWLPLVAALVLGGHLAGWSVVREYGAQQDRFGQEVAQHLRLVLSSLGLALLLGAPLAVWAARRERVAGAVLGLAGAVQTVPSLALLGLLIAPLAALSTAFPMLRSLGISGIGTAPALTAMTLYALLPILRNGVVALRGVPPGVLDAARGMGMTDAQRFWRVQLPLALPVWLSGVRQAAVVLVGVASIAQLIGAGGLGYFIFSGMQSGAADLILLGAIPAALLAVLLDALLRGLETWLGRRYGGPSAP